jgi:hypothetical protein
MQPEKSHPLHRSASRSVSCAANRFDNRSVSRAAGHVAHRVAAIVCFAISCCFCFPNRAAAAVWHVAPDGDDAAAGSLAKPFATVQRAQKAASPGDTVYLRGGVYKMQEAQIARRDGIFAYLMVLDKSGEKGKPITYAAYQDEKPVFDCTDVKPANCRVDAFLVSGSWLHLRGIDVTGVQVTITGHTQSICFEVHGDNNIFERLTMHDGQAIGVYLARRASQNLILNCDAWNNWDYTSEGGAGGNADGFGCHGDGAGNIFRGCRAWYNSDDGFDCINQAQAVVFEDCWAFYNGLNKAGKSLGDGNGFKAGGYGIRNSNVPNPIPRNTVRNCIAVRNKVSGFYANHHPGGGDWYNNSAYANGRANYNFLCHKPDPDKTKRGVDIPGAGHVIRNNLSHGTPPDRAVIQLAATGNQIDHNAFPPGMVLSDSDFESLDETQLTAPRQPGGGLPKLTFLKPKAGTPLIGAGVNVGLPFAGEAPDIGAISQSPEKGNRN